MTFETFINNTTRVLKDNAPAILTALGVTGLVGTSYLTARGALLAQRDIHEALSEQTQELTPKEKIRLTWIRFVPAVTVGAATVGCMVGSNILSNRKNAALMGAVAMGDLAFREYRDKMIEVVGKNKDQKVIDEISSEAVVKNPPAKEFVFSETGKSLVLEKMTGRYFESSMELLRKAQNDFNQMMLRNDYGLLNDLFEFMGLDRVDVGDELGWNNDEPLEMVFTTTMFQDKPITVVTYRRPPFPNAHSPF